MKAKKIALIAAPLCLALSLGAAWFGTRSSQATAAATGTAAYEFATVGRATVESSVSSTGTLSPVSTVSVIPQMSGRVEKVNVDWNDRVRAGQVLASLDTDLLELQEKEARAALRKASSSRALLELDLRNKSGLSEKGLLSDYEFAVARTALEVAAAELDAAQASLEAIQTRIGKYALVTSPIDGVVLERDVEPGQSVQEGSSANSSSLFTIAESLARMEIKAEVDELDIGYVAQGQAVRFTVEAVPGASFAGRVHEVRLVPESADNVVTYFVMIDVSNPEGKLLPGMTASVQFIRASRTDVLAVPTAALRFQPAGMGAAAVEKAVYLATLGELGAAERGAASRKYDEELKAAAAAKAAGTARRKTPGLAGMMMQGPGGPPGSRSSSTDDTSEGDGSPGGIKEAATQAVSRKRLWYLDDSGALAVALVDTGASSGQLTEISGADWLEGRAVILRAKEK